MATPKQRSHLVFVLGGASSGKSDVALRFALKGIGKGASRVFVATGEGLDEEMATKIARHRQVRSLAWVTAEVPMDLTGWWAAMVPQGQGAVEGGGGRQLTIGQRQT